MSEVPVYLITYNCARKQLVPEVLARHIFSSLDTSSALPELVAVAVQELAPLRESFLGGSFLHVYWKSWELTLTTAFKSIRPPHNGLDEGYTLVAKHNVGMIGCAVFARSPEKVKSIEFASVGCGFYEMGNKGAAGIKLKYVTDGGSNGAKGSATLNLAFVSTHLAPHEQMCEKRNEDWETIARGLVFTPEGITFNIAKQGTESEPLITNGAHGTALDGLYSSDTNTFIFGDLNYRTSSLRPAKEDVEAFPKPTGATQMDDNLHLLFEQDQLLVEKSAGKTLQGLHEAKVNFEPTYKYNLHEHPDDNDPQTYVPNRWPSWCDRILWTQPKRSSSSSSTRFDVQVHRYMSIPQLNLSDHKPVALHASLVPRSSDGSIDFEAPFTIDPNWQSRRAAGRRLEFSLGVFLSIFWTWIGWFTIATVGFSIWTIWYSRR